MDISRTDTRSRITTSPAGAAPRAVLAEQRLKPSSSLPAIRAAYEARFASLIKPDLFPQLTVPSPIRPPKPAVIGEMGRKPSAGIIGEMG